VTVTNQFAGDDFYGNDAAGSHQAIGTVAYKF
jgi:hypothetical protein